MWKVEYRKRFLKELAKLPLHVQARAEKLVFEELAGENPFELELLEHMKGYPGKYKNPYWPVQDWTFIEQTGKTYCL